MTLPVTTSGETPYGYQETDMSNSVIGMRIVVGGQWLGDYPATGWDGNFHSPEHVRRDLRKYDARWAAADMPPAAVPAPSLPAGVTTDATPHEGFGGEVGRYLLRGNRPIQKVTLFDVRPDWGRQ